MSPAGAPPTGPSTANCCRNGATPTRARSSACRPATARAATGRYRATSLAAIEPTTATAEGYAFLTELVRRLTRDGANGGRDADHLPRPHPRQVEDVRSDHRRIDDARVGVGYARPLAAPHRASIESMTDAPTDLPVSRAAGPRRPPDDPTVGSALIVDRSRSIVGAAADRRRALVLAHRRWFPVLDLAMTEFRVRDVGGRHTPLIGLPGPDRRVPRPGQPPRPAQLLARGARLPAVREFGRGRWRRRPSSCRLAWISVALWIGHRRARNGRRRGRRRGDRRAAAGLRADRTHPAVEPVPAALSPGSWSCSPRGRCCAATT